MALTLFSLTTSIILRKFKPNELSECSLVCSDLILKFGSSTDCQIKDCPAEISKSVTLKIKPLDTEVTTNYSEKEQQLSVDSAEDTVNYFNMIFFNPAVDYLRTGYKHVRVYAEPPVFNSVVLSFYTSLLEETYAGTTLARTVSTSENSTITKALHFCKRQIKVYPEKTIFGSAGASSILGKALKKVANGLTLSVFEALNTNKELKKLQFFMHLSPLSGKQKIKFVVTSARKEPQTFRALLLKDEHCQAKAKGVRVVDRDQAEELCEGDEINGCKGSKEIEANLVCFVVSCGSNYTFTNRNVQKHCLLDLSVQFIDLTLVDSEKLLTAKYELGIKRPFHHYILALFGLLVCIFGIGSSFLLLST